jgi:hypothetical protein
MLVFGDDRLPERFWNKVSVEPNTGCWLWTAGLAHGYGKFKVGRRTLGAHRVAYECLVGPVANDLECDHLCRQRCCVNPAHLEPVTPRENIARSPIHVGSKTHCPAGHAYSSDNLVSNGKNQWRCCRTCHSARLRARRAAANENR